MTILQPLADQLASISSDLLFIAGFGIVILFFLWLLIITILVLKNHFWLKRVFGKAQKEDIKEILQEHIERVGIVQIKLNDLDNMLTGLKESSLEHVQKIGIVRFNPFDDTGSDQSFSLAALDGNDDGFVISALHGRERTRMYTKPIKKGKPGKYPFSDEEEEAIRRAQRPDSD